MRFHSAAHGCCPVVPAVALTVMVLSSLLSAGVVGDGDSDGDDSVALLTVTAVSVLLSFFWVAGVGEGERDGGVAFTVSEAMMQVRAWER
ncbi:MAG: hypothetical protein MPK62_07700 [Alphaproteobacteria bacterium]|nr:hypothetical protein [Alphaproteobacteria bacterium]